MATQWAAVVLAVAKAPTDITTLDCWAGLVNVSRSTLFNRCRAVRANAKDSLGLGRVARAVVRGAADPWLPEHWLNMADHRTLVSLIQQAGLTAYCHASPPSLQDLLAQHTFDIPRDTAWLLAGMLVPPLPPLSR